MEFDYMPPELKLKIFSYLSQEDLSTASKVSDNWCELSGDPHLWKKLVICACKNSTRQILDIVEHCHLVEEIRFSGVYYWNWVSFSPECKFLRKFEFDICEIDSEEMSRIVAQFPFVDTVKITDLDCEGDVVDEIMRWKNMRSLSITIAGESYDGSDAVVHLANFCPENCASLEEVNLLFDGFVADDEFSTFSTIRGADVKTLSLDCYSFLDHSTYASLKKYTSLSTLRLYNTEFVTDDDLVHLRELTSLQELHLSAKSGRKRNVTPTGFENLFKDAKFVNLEAIYIKSCDISDSGLTYLTESCPNLKTLELWRCKKISSVGLNSIMANCKQMENLYLTGLRSVTPHTVRQLPIYLRKLTRFCVSCCSKIKPKHIKQLRLENPNLDFNDRRPYIPRKNEFQIRF